MKNLFWVFIASFIFSSNIFSGDGYRHGTSAKSQFNYPSGYGMRLLNSLGNSGIENSTSNLGFMNPASIVDLPNYSIGLTYQVSTPVYFPKPLEDMSMPRVYYFIPQSFGAIYHYDDFSFGLSLGQEFNSAIDFGEIPVTTVQFPEGTGVVFTPIIESTIEKYSLSLAYNLGKSIFEDADVSVGLRYNLNRLHGYEKILNVVANESVFGSSFEIGLVYNSNDILKFGISVKSGSSFTISNNENNLLNPDSLRGSYYYKIDIPDRTEETPSELNLDALFQLNSDLQLTASVNNIFWSSVNSFISNQLDVSSNLIYNLSDRVTSSAGLLLSNCSMDDAYRDYEENEYNALFFMAGLKLNYETFNIDFALADSHLISGELRKQLIAKVGVGLQL